MTADAPPSAPMEKFYWRNAAGRSHDTVVLAVILLVLNLFVLCKILPLELFLLYPRNIDKEWWRIITHFFVHSDAYHFLLDFVTFIVLYRLFPETDIYKKILYLATIAACDVISCILLSRFDWICGLSGLNYGLLTIVCCTEANLFASKSRTKIGLPVILLILIIAKTAAEVLFTFISGHNIDYPFFGYISSESHAGGIIGGLVVSGVKSRH